MMSSYLLPTRFFIILSVYSPHIFIEILLFSTTGPIIESSSSIVFGCYNFNYFDLERNITNTSNSTIETHRSVTSGLNIYNNLWYDVYNFTPDSGSNHYLTLSQLDESMVYSQSIFDDFKTSTMSPPQSNPNSKNGSKGKRPSRSHGNWAYKLLALNFNEYSDILSQLYKYNNKIQYILEEQLQIVTPISNTIRPVVPMTCGKYGVLL